MAQYLVLIYDNEDSWSTASQEAVQQMHKEYMDFGERNAKVVAGGNALHPTNTATSIRGYGSGEFSVTDGPFTETKEALGGYYLIEAVDLDEAIAVAKQVPAFGGVEVRPIRVITQG
ncbi:MAG TPA: YciI family protein [Pseudonocardiaceae bacterium]|jgi:hypothetical protein|nr:YciI family protein [Pseudonocardiaceae bacterium]